MDLGNALCIRSRGWVNNMVTFYQQLQIGSLYAFKMVGQPLPPENMNVFWLDFKMSPLEELLMYLGNKDYILFFLGSDGSIREMSIFGLQNHGEVGIYLFEVNFYK